MHVSLKPNYKFRCVRHVDLNQFQSLQVAKAFQMLSFYLKTWNTYTQYTVLILINTPEALQLSGAYYLQPKVN